MGTRDQVNETHRSKPAIPTDNTRTGAVTWLFGWLFPAVIQ